LSQIQQNKNQSEGVIHNNHCSLLYDPLFLNAPQANLLNHDILQQATSSERITSGGRGQAWFIEINGHSAVYRKYMRGGLVARLIQQTYFGLNVENTRSVKEWRMLQWMHGQGLPVPQAIAASVCRWPFGFSPFYRAQILVQRISNVQTLDEILTQRELTSTQWQGVGECIRRFHNAGVYHADLNANNILLNTKGSVYLVDFDKGELRGKSVKTETWMEENLQRLKRSLLKQQGVHQNYFFTQTCWQLLIDAYRV